MSSESYIVCEGFHDRAFWAGWLTHLGCNDPGKTGKGDRKDVYDPWNVVVKSGRYAFHSRGGQFIRVVPVHGVKNLLPAARIRLKEHATKPLARLILNLDLDDAPGPNIIMNLLHGVDASAKQVGDDLFEFQGGKLHVNLIAWQAHDAARDVLPAGQTLERLVCAALAAVHPDRAAAVHRWLSSRPEPPAASVKEFAWSQMAGWYADRGCESFYQAVWEDPAIAAQLEKRLKEANSWNLIQGIAESSVGG